MFDRVDRQRAIALAGEAGPAMVDALRSAGVPGVWDERARELRLHPRIREILGEELETAPTAERAAAWTSAAAVYEREGEIKLALDALIEAGDLDGARRLLPSVIMDVVGRLDVEEAERLLAAVPMDPEPPEVMYARLCLAVVEQAAAGALPVLAALERDGNAADVFAKLPAVGAIVVLMYTAIGRVAEAFAALEQIPPGRAYDTARLILADERDDPDAPAPAFAGDMLDALDRPRTVLARRRSASCRGSRARRWPSCRACPTSQIAARTAAAFSQVDSHASAGPSRRVISKPLRP